MIKIWDRKPLIELWNAGTSARLIKERLDLPISIRQIQRIGEQYGDRKKRASGRLRADQAFIGTFRGLVEPLMIEQGKDPYTCALCGANTGKKMTIHHTKYEGAMLMDLVFACWSCQLQHANLGLA